MYNEENYTKKDREIDYQAPPNLYKLIVHKRKHLSDSAYSQHQV